MELITTTELIENIQERNIRIEKTKIDLVMYWYEQGRDLISLRDKLHTGFDDLPSVVGISKSSIYNYVSIGKDERISKLLSFSNGGKINADTKYIEQFNQKQIVKLSTLNDVEFVEALQSGKLPTAKSEAPQKAELTALELIEHKQEQIQLLEDEILELQSELSNDTHSDAIIDADIIQSEPKAQKEFYNQKQINQIDLHTREVIATFESLAKANHVTGFSKSSISKCCTGKQKKAHGYKWEFVEVESDNE